MTLRRLALMGATAVVLASCAAPPESSPPPSGPSPPSTHTGTSSGLVPNYSLLIHCGVRYAVFDGASWEVKPPAPHLSDTVVDPKTGGGHSRDSISGRMVRVSDTAAVFTTTEEPAGVVVHFHRSSTTPAPCA